MEKRNFILMLAVLGTASFFSPAFAEEQPRSVSVSGTGEVEAIPDAAFVGMAIEARDKKLASAQAEVDEKVSDFLKLVDKLGIDRKFVKTTGKTVRPEHRWDDKTRKQYLIGYYVSRQLQVDLRDLEKLGDLMHRAVEAGVNQVSPPQLRATNEQQLRREALAKAADDARANAAVLAAALDAKLGPVRQISAQDQMHLPQPRYRMAMAMESSADMAPEQTYETGQIKITATVNATFDLK